MHGSDCRIFQQKSVPDIIKQILGEYSINVVTWDLIEPHEVRVYCVQYRETHYEFITRIAAEEALNGIGAK